MTRQDNNFILGAPISFSELNELVESGRMITLAFVKKNGDMRVINGRTGVTKHTVGGRSTVNHAKYWVIFEPTEGYRCVSKQNTVGYVTVNSANQRVLHMVRKD